jgi:hypothetical protein
MSKKKITFHKVDHKESNVRAIGSLTIDFSGVLLDGAVLSLEKYAEWEYLVRELGLALLGYTKAFKSEITGMPTVQAYMQYLKWFTTYLDEAMPVANKKEVRLKDITSELFAGYYTWCHDRKGFKTATRSKAYHGIRRLIEYHQDANSSLVADDFAAIGKSPTRFVQYDNAEVYSDLEIDEMLDVCRTEINKVLQRLKLGESYLKVGVDPTDKKIRSTLPWGKIENILWYIKYKLNGRILTREEYKIQGHYQLLNVLCGTRPEYQWRKTEVYSYLYPSRYDLLPFLIMLSIKTGLNKESISSLKRDCIDEATKTDVSFKLKFSKSKTHTTYDARRFSCNGRFSVYQIVKEVLRITDPLVPYADEPHRNFLFIGVVNNAIKGTVKPFTDGAYLTDMLNTKNSRGWLYSHGLGHIRYEFDRMRETWATRRYKETGNLGKVQKELRHKYIGTSALHYIDGEATRDIHEQVLVDVQNDLIFDGTVKGDQNESLVHQDDNQIDFRDERVKEQDVFFASCKDFYNRPGGERNTPCDQPWSCFTCKNGVWTSSILPRVIAFYNFIEDQKSVLPLIDWESKFGVPYLIIRNHILPKFKKETLAWAEREAIVTLKYIPNSIRMF